jgi:hypothetical protein
MWSETTMKNLDGKCWKVLLLLFVITVVCVSQVDSASSAARAPAKIDQVNAPPSVSQGLSFQVAVKLSGIYTGSEARVRILDPPTGRTWSSSTYNGNSQGIVGATVAVTAPQRAGTWCLKALLDFAPKAGSRFQEAVDQRGFCIEVLTVVRPTTPTPTPPPEITAETDWAVGKVWMIPEHRSPLSTVPYINANESATFHCMVYLSSIDVSPPEYQESVLSYVTAQLMFLLDGSVRNDLFPPVTLSVKIGKGFEFSTKNIIGKDGGRVHTFGFRISSYFRDPQPRDNENSSQFIVAGLPSAKITSIKAPNMTTPGSTLDIGVVLELSATFGADLQVILVDLGSDNGTGKTFDKMTREKPISGASSGDKVAFTVTAPSTPMMWHLKAEAWTRAKDSKIWRHDDTDWTEDFTIRIMLKAIPYTVTNAKVIGVGAPGTVLPGNTFTVSAIIEYEFSNMTNTRITATSSSNQTQAVTETLSGTGQKTYTLKMTAPASGSMDIKVQVEYQRPGNTSWQHDSDQWYKTLTVHIFTGAKGGFLPDWWNQQVEKPFKDIILDPIRRLLGI